ncbi:MAG TPA: NnrS family protein [Candidatus Desulfobacillus sp.]|nr:NnrS family protein [Candidatus Desulfobacillus sp.]
MAEAAPAKPKKKADYRPAGVFFFPATTLYAALVIPWTLHGWLHGVPLPPGLRFTMGHAHEMLFGFALAVMGGFLITRVERPALAVLAASWLASRAAWLLWPGSWLSALADVAFAGLFLHRALPQFLVSVKKWRNHATSVGLTGLALALTLFQAALLLRHEGWLPPIRTATVLLLVLMMSFMGGRMIAPAVAGHMQGKGFKLETRVQPYVEGALIILLPLAVFMQGAGWNRLTALALLAASLLVLVRWLRWRWWHCLDRFDLLALAVGYLWLSIGLALLALEALSSETVRPVALHGITIGALGSLTATVMIRTRLMRCKIPPSQGRLVLPMTLVISLAAVLRMTPLPHDAGLIASAWLWSLVFATAFVYLIRIGKAA